MKMKECRKCEFPNIESDQFCQKCHESLSGIEAKEPGVRFKGEDPTKTTLGKRIEKTAWDENEPLEEKKKPAQNMENNRCPVCNYPRRNNQTECPDCKPNQYPESSDGIVSGPIASTFGTTDSVTMNPYLKPDAEGTKDRRAVLVRIPRANQSNEERIALFGGNGEVTISRDLVDKGNDTISSGGHAAIRCKNGFWTISNVGRTGTTFKQVTDDCALQHGDVILLGNRMFRFELEEEK